MVNGGLHTHSMRLDSAKWQATLRGLRDDDPTLTKLNLDGEERGSQMQMGWGCRREEGMREMKGQKEKKREVQAGGVEERQVNAGSGWKTTRSAMRGRANWQKPSRPTAP